MTVTFNQDGFAETSGEIIVYCTDNQGIYSHSATEYVSEGGSLSAGSYLDAPPQPKQGFVIVRADKSWQYQADHRGTYYSKETGEKVEHTALGGLPENLTALAPLTEPCKWNGTAWVKDEVKIADNFTKKQTRLIAKSMSTRQKSTALGHVLRVNTANAKRRQKPLNPQIMKASAVDISPILHNSQDWTIRPPQT